MLSILTTTKLNAQGENPSLVIEFDAFRTHLNHQTLQQLNELTNTPEQCMRQFVLRSWSYDSLAVEIPHTEAALIQRRINMTAAYLQARGVDSISIDRTWWKVATETNNKTFVFIQGHEPNVAEHWVQLAGFTKP